MSQARQCLPSAESDARGTTASPHALPWLLDPPRASWEPKFLLGLLLLLAILLLPLLDRVPRAYGDDSWSAMAGYTLAFEGRPRNPGQMRRGGTDNYLLQPRLFPNVVCAPVYRLAGYGLVQARAVAVVFCGIFVFAAYALTRRLFGPVAAAATAVMTAIDPWVFICGRTCREEIFLAALLWLSWWLLLEAIDRRSGWRALLGGLCIGLACWTHPNAGVFSAAALVAILAAAGWRTLKGAWWLWAALGVAVGLAPYLAYVGYVQGTTDLRVMDQVAERTGAYFRPLTDMLVTEKDRWVNFLRLPLRTPLLLLCLWAVGWAMWRGRRPDRLLALLIIVAAVLMPILVRVPHGRYLVVLVPALTALIWRCLPAAVQTGAEAAGRIGPALRRVWIGRGVTAGALLIYAAMALPPTLAVFYAYRGADYDRWVARVAQHIPRDGYVMAHTMYWTGLHDRRFISSIPPYFSDWLTEDDAVAHIEKYRPEFLIQSSLEFGSLGGTAPRSAELRATPFGRACDQVAARVPAHRLTEFYDRDFGAVRVWKLDWPARP